MTQAFNPLDFGFCKLDPQHGSLCFYELSCGDLCNGRIDRHRITMYLTQDGDFVTIWHGLFDASLIDQAFHDSMARIGQHHFDFGGSYNTPLFRGYITTQEEARVILKAIRFEGFRPSILRLDAENRICCDLL